MNKNDKVDLELDEFVTFKVNNQLFGLNVLDVRDVFKPTKITHIPKAPEVVFGVLNLRGRIVTVIDMYSILGIHRDESLVDNSNSMNIVVEYRNESYALLVDKVGDVMYLSQDTFDDNPKTLNEKWASLSNGIHKLDNDILIILDVSKTLSFLNNKAV